jgi:hypothetical protein
MSIRHLLVLATAALLPTTGCSLLGAVAAGSAAAASAPEAQPAPAPAPAATPAAAAAPAPAPAPVVQAAPAPAPVSISAIKVQVKRWSGGDAKGKYYLRVEFKGKLEATTDEMPRMRLRSTCDVGEEQVVDTSLVTGSSRFKDMQAGQVTGLDTIAFGIDNALASKPKRCSLEVILERGYGSKKREQTVATACWSGGKVADGGCE